LGPVLSSIFGRLHVAPQRCFSHVFVWQAIYIYFDQPFESVVNCECLETVVPFINMASMLYQRQLEKLC
jgi:hypothetical protein